ncbi:MAG: YggT family protein [Eubacteriales bacterium]
MGVILYIILSALRMILYAFYVLLIIRAVLSWLPQFQNRFTDFIYGITEPVLTPVRELLDRLGVSSALPIDLSFMVVVLVIWLLLCFI